jgi:hypothetical protein
MLIKTLAQWHRQLEELVQVYVPEADQYDHPRDAERLAWDRDKEAADTLALDFWQCRSRLF